MEQLFPLFGREEIPFASSIFSIYSRLPGSNHLEMGEKRAEAAIQNKLRPAARD